MVRSLLLFTVLTLVLTGLGFADQIQDLNLAQEGEIVYVNEREERQMFINDGDFATNWSNQNTPTFVLDLGADVEFDFIAFVSYSNRWHSYVVVDSTTGDTIVDRSTNQDLANTFVDQMTADTLDTPVTARYLKVIINAGASGWQGLSELIVKKLNGVYNAPLPVAQAASSHVLNVKMQLLDEKAVDQWNVYDETDALVGTAAGDAEMVEIAGLDANTTYSFYVGAVVGADEYIGNTFEGTTMPRLTDLSGSAQSANSVKLTWSDNADDEDGFNVYKQSADESWTLLQMVTDAEFVEGGLTENTEYTYAVSTVVGGADADTSVVSVTTMPGVTDLTAKRFSTQQVIVYFMDKGETNDGAWIFYSADGVEWESMTVASKSDEVVADTVMVGGLKCGTTYHVYAQPYTGETGWTPSDTIQVTTFPMLPAMSGPAVLFDEDFTDGHVDQPMAWEWADNGYDITAPNLRDADYALVRKIAEGGDTWGGMPVWGHFDDRNANGEKDAGEYKPFEINLEEDVVVFKTKTYSDIASNSTEYYNINPRIHGPGAHGDGLLQLKLNYNTKGPNGYNRQVHPMVNGEQYPEGAPSWQLPPYLSYGNFAYATDSTLSETFENLILYRPVVDSAEQFTNVEAWTENAPAYDGKWAASLGEGSAYIDHMQLLMVRPALRLGGSVLRTGITEQDLQLGVEHMQLGITKKADFTLDYVVDIEDFFALASGWGEADTVREGREIFIFAKTMVQGDANNDGMVDDADYEVLKSFMNQGEYRHVHHYAYDTPAHRVENHALVAEVNTRTGVITLRGSDGLDVVGYKLVSRSGGFSYYPSSPLFSKGIRTFTATQIGEGNLTPHAFTVDPRSGEDLRSKHLGRCYNTDINPRDLRLVWQSELGGETYMGGVSYVDMPFDGNMMTSVAGTAPDTTDEMIFAHYAMEKDRRNVYWNGGGGRDMGQQFVVDAVTTLDKITMAVFPHAWGNMLDALELAQDAGCFIRIVKTPTYENSNQISEVIATYYGNLPSVLDTLNNRFITFDLPGDGIVLEPLEGDSTWGFLFGFASPAEGREINFSITHPYKDEFEAPDYLGGSKIDLTWKQGRNIDPSLKYNPQGWEWGHQTTFWLEASSIGAVSVAEEEALPTSFDLSQNYPNPFNPTTTITYSLPEQSDVTLVVFDIMGRQVTKLVDQRVNAGIHNVIWDAKDTYGNKVASGVYYYRLQANDRIFTKKMMLVK